MEQEVSKLLGFRWFALTDKQFKATTINMTSSVYVDGYEWRHNNNICLNLEIF